MKNTTLEVGEILNLLQNWGKTLRMESQEILIEQGCCYDYLSLGDQISLLAHLVRDVKRMGKIIGKVK